LVPGISSNSYGHYVALQSGIPKSIVDRAIEVKKNLTQGQAIEPLGGDSSRTEEYRNICAAFLEFDCERGDVVALMNDIFRMRVQV